MKKIFLDLEGTCIISWDDTTLCNVNILNKFLSDQTSNEINIFSFAIWNDKDRDEFFENGLKETLESIFNVKINQIPTAEEVMNDTFRKRGIITDVSEFIQLWGKQRAFIDWIQNTHKDCDVILIDDMIPNMKVVFHDINVNIELINIGRLGEWINPVRC